ncbi:hypothetical protein [uncultured Corynebacterium sp.]|uniref:hypothetical protein n=1 Tax=uncultured Corynebacterium sp. TaxID=159447 RepID=UPI0025D5892C|nr:hypothetical protein [uncultured Corynebacterium sp.]
MTSRLATPADANRKVGTRALLLALVLIVPLVIGAVVATVSEWQPAEAWSQEQAGAPSDGTIDPAELYDVARALSEANAQAGFLASGAQQLADGTGELKDGAGELGGGVDKLAGGSQELYDGLVQLQSGTAQLGNGATELADGVGGAVDQVIGLGVVRGQILQAIDGTLKDLEGNNSAEAKNIRSQLGDLRSQVENFQFDQSVQDQLTQLKDGSRELSNQLAVSGYAYHDGVYQATEGAKQLNAGIGELNSKVDEALQGVDKLVAGAEKVDGMAQQNRSKVQGAQRALPTVAGPAEDDSAPSQLLSPIVAMLLAAIAVLGGGVIGALLTRVERRILALLGGAVLIGVVVGLLVALLATGGTAAAVAWAGLAAAGAGAASASIVYALVRGLGLAGWGLGSVLGVAQVGVVGWAWKAASTGTDLNAAMSALVHLFPMQWATSAITVAGNGGQSPQLWTALAILGVISIVAFVLVGAPARHEENGKA